VHLIAAKVGRHHRVSTKSDDKTNRPHQKIIYQLRRGNISRRRAATAAPRLLQIAHECPRFPLGFQGGSFGKCDPLWTARNQSPDIDYNRMSRWASYRHARFQLILSPMLNTSQVFTDHLNIPDGKWDTWYTRWELRLQDIVSALEDFAITAWRLARSAKIYKTWPFYISSLSFSKQWSQGTDRYISVLFLYYKSKIRTV